jgi:Na+-transporting methylmalonyl-CoA/oxaloacetate decarboxylase gamma subunit
MGFVLLMLAMLLFSFRVLSAAVLTQPPITKIEEMGGLVH